MKLIEMIDVSISNEIFAELDSALLLLNYLYHYFSLHCSNMGCHKIVDLGVLR